MATFFLAILWQNFGRQMNRPLDAYPILKALFQIQQVGKCHCFGKSSNFLQKLKIQGENFLAHNTFQSLSRMGPNL